MRRRHSAIEVGRRLATCIVWRSEDASFHVPYSAIEGLAAGLTCVSLAIAASYIWPSFPPFDPSIFLAIKHSFWSSWFVVPFFVVLIALPIQLLVNAALSSGHRVACWFGPSLSCLLMAIVAIYVGAFVPSAQFMGGEWLLRMCIEYCGDPWDDCRVSYRPIVRGSGGGNVTEHMLDVVYGRPMDSISLSVLLTAESLVVSCSGSSQHLTLPRSVQRVMLGKHPERLHDVDVDASLRVPADWIRRDQHYISNAAQAHNALADILRENGIESISIYGCSIDGKIAYLAALTSRHPYDYAVIDSGGALVSSMRVVGPCGETVRAMQERWPNWIKASIPDEDDWKYDVGDMMENCRSTRFIFTTSEHDMWNNPMGLTDTLARGHAFGCNIEVMRGYAGRHCLF